VIEVEQLTKRYGARTAVADVTFSVEKGEVVGFLGPNGAGKSTTLRVITGFLAPTAGQVRVGGIDAIADPLGARRQIGYMPEGVPLYPEMRVREYLRYRAELKEVPRRDLTRRVGDALERANIVDVQEQIIGQLSKGYRQRVGLADALVADPPLLILDEPTAGLDPNQIRQVRDLIASFEGDKTVFLSTHILPEVEASCSRVVIIHRGRVVGEGPPETLRDRSAGEQRVSLVGRGERTALEEALLGAEGVASLEHVLGRGDVHTFRLKTVAGAEVMERIFAAVVEAGGVLRELGREEGRLEDVFASLTTAEAEALKAGLAGPSAAMEPSGEEGEDADAHEDEDEREDAHQHEDEHEDAHEDEDEREDADEHEDEHEDDAPPDPSAEEDPK
jgi:ABC-2 type transport system ATP-binding protein